jgi:hypothetical protein
VRVVLGGIVGEGRAARLHASLLLLAVLAIPVLICAKLEGARRYARLLATCVTVVTGW